MKKTLLSLLLAAGSLAGMSANAALVNIVNHSFESTVLPDGSNTAGSIFGWVNTTGGVFNPTTAHFSNPIPDGNNTAWLNGGSATQTLSTVLTANTAYTLMVEVGDRKDNVFPGYSVALLTGSTVLATESSLHPNDGFLTSTVNFTALAGNTHLGQALTIRLTADGTQVNFDNVRLDVSPVPEPEIYALMLAGLGLVGFAARRRA